MICKIQVVTVGEDGRKESISNRGLGRAEELSI